MSQPRQEGPHTGTEPSRPRLPGVTGLLILALLTALGLAQLLPPIARPASSPANAFSAERAFTHVKAIALEPHPTGSAADRRVIGYLTEQFTALGLQPQVFDSGVLTVGPDWVRAARVNDLLLRIPGTDSSKAVLLVSHHDSVGNGPGASDAASGVATILETVRALKSAPPLRNDLILLITDAEEEGMLGAGAFVARHPWAKEVGLVLNLEARGTAGPVLMFRTSPDSGRLVREFAQAAPDPVTGSAFSSLLRLIPNDTDLSVFLNAGMNGMDFAFLDNWPAYHTALDSPENLDRRSLQQEGAQVLALVKHFGNLDLSDLRAPDVTYFTLFGQVILYPMAWALPLALFALLLLALTLWVGLRRGRLRIGAVAWSFGALLLTSLAAAAAFMLFYLLARWLLQGRMELLSGATYDGGLYIGATLALTLTVVITLAYQFKRRLTAEELTAGGLLLWALLTLGTAIWLDGVSYLFLWPALLTTAALLVRVTARQPESTPVRLAVWLLPALSLLLLAPFLLLLMWLLPLRFYAGIVLLLVFALWLFPLHLTDLARKRDWLVPSVGLGVAVALVAAAGFRLPQHPQASDLFYVMDADRGQAVWVTPQGEPDAYTTQFFADAPTRTTMNQLLPMTSTMPVLAGPAPLVTQPLPEIRILEERTDGSTRQLKLLALSPRKAARLTLAIETDGGIQELILDDRSVQRAEQGLQQGQIRLTLINPAPEGTVFSMRVKAGATVSIQMVEEVRDLSAVPGYPFGPRPANLMPFADTDGHAILYRSLKL